MTEELAVVDYGAGNLKSVQNALAHLSARFVVTSDPDTLRHSQAMIFPGVGEAFSAMAEIKRTGLDQAIREFYTSGRKMLGICIGCQIIMDRSEERDTTCLGLIPGSVRRFSAGNGHKVPHMGWNQVRFVRPHPMLRGITEGSSFYFVHAYYPAPEREDDVEGWTEYGIVFPSMIARGNLVATQFHLEKSGEAGLRLLSGFLEWKA